MWGIEDSRTFIDKEPTFSTHWAMTWFIGRENDKEKCIGKGYIFFWWWKPVNLMFIQQSSRLAAIVELKLLPFAFISSRFKLFLLIYSYEVLLYIHAINKEKSTVTVAYGAWSPLNLKLKDTLKMLRTSCLASYSASYSASFLGFMLVSIFSERDLRNEICNASA